MHSLDDTKRFMEAIETKLSNVQENRIPFRVFLENKMDEYDYSYTSLAKKVYHRVERKKEGRTEYVPVTRQAIGAWLRGSMPSSREIYISLGMAFHMSLEEINYILLETYMGYGLYCKNIEDALWIALINGLFEIDRMEEIKNEVERILVSEEEESNRSLATMDLWVMLSQARSLEQFFSLIHAYKEEFLDGTKRFGECLLEVIEEEYGYYEKATWFLRDIGCLHCEAQFSKIRAGKAVVTREWLLRFCIAMMPSYESIEKLLSKAQMEPLGITPGEIILEMIAKYKADTVANSQEIWIMTQAVVEDLRKKGYEIEDDLCLKYNSVSELPIWQKWWFCMCIGKELLHLQSLRDHGYEKEGYCRHASVDRLLFEDMNRNKKSVVFKKNAKLYWDMAERDMKTMEFQEIPSLRTQKEIPADTMDLEKFEDYCYMRKPSRFSKDFLMNDIYFFSAVLYSIWTGKCYQRDFGTQNKLEMLDALSREGMEHEDAEGKESGHRLVRMMEENLKEDAVYTKCNNIENMLDALCSF